MEYSITKLAALAGVSTRTLRYYDSINLLSPARTSSSGYRIYGEAEVNRLQQILFYRELEFPLEEIAVILSRPDYDPLTELYNHRQGLSQKQARLSQLLETLDKTIAATERNQIMKNEEKFAGFKEQMIADNEAAYGEEIRRAYGNTAIDAANHKLRTATQEDLDETDKLACQILELLDISWEKNDFTCDEAVRMAALHKEWLCRYWTRYSIEAHTSLCDMYTEDSRFAGYYDRGTPGKAQFLRKAVRAWLGL